MKAMVINDFGPPDVFEAQEVPKPEPGVNDVLVKVHATSINPVDYKVRQAGSWAVEPPAILGYDVSGVVEAVGEGVSDLAVGDEVYYTSEIFSAQGTYAEYHVADKSIVAHKPSNLSHAEAASIPLAGVTSWDALMMDGNRISVGETILIHGAGGVGSLAIQIARAAGARVLATCSDYMVQTVQALGADRAINYKSESFTTVVQEETAGAGVDFVLDTVGGDLLTRSIEVTRPFGRMAGIVSTDTSFRSAGFKNITVRFVFLQRARHKLDALRRLVERGQLKPVVDSVLPLEEVAEAHRRLEAGGVKGKIVLQVVR